jgi:RimJ/RimL family protein N-acetyltransferase
MPPTPVFETEKILLRPFSPDDAPALHQYLSHPDLTGRRYIPWKFEQHRPIPLQDAKEIIDHWYENKESFAYAIILKEEDTLIGHAKADWEWDPHMSEAAVLIAPPYQRKGYGTQAITLVLNYLFDFSMAHNVSSGINAWNTPAEAFVRHLGFKQVGTRRDSAYLAGQFYDVHVFDILRPEWKEVSHAVDR